MLRLVEYSKNKNTVNFVTNITIYFLNLQFNIIIKNQFKYKNNNLISILKIEKKNH